MKAVLYIRVSDEEQVKEGFSIEAQESLLKRKCAEWKYEIVGKPYIDEGLSAKNMKRPALKKMLNDAALGLFDVIVFWRLDRFTRRSKDFQTMAEHLEKNNCSFRSATEPYDTTTAIGRFQLELAISLGQLERETTAERVHMVMEERHRKGMRNGAIASFGYTLDENGGLVPLPDEFELGKRIYDMYRNGFTDYKGVRRAGFRSIAVQLNWEGKLHRGSPWSYNSIRYFLANPANAGHLRWNYRKSGGKKTGNEIITEGTHEAMISQEDFDYIQTVMDRRKTSGKRTTSVHPFSGVLRCGRCGHSMAGTTVRRNVPIRYYRCNNRMKFKGCDMPFVKEESVLEAFFEALEAPNISDMVEKPSIQTNERAEIERELSKIKKHKEKWQNMFLNDLVDMNQLKAELDQFREREKILNEKLSTLPMERRDWSKKDIAKQLKQFAKLWNSIDNQVAKKNFLYDVFETITINTDVTNPKVGPGYRLPCYIEDMTFRD